MNEDTVLSGTERILFVDDEPMLTALAMAMLGSLGYLVETKTSATEALELFRNDPHSFDLVITDQTMPEMSGAEMVLEMMSVRPDIPVILCSGYSEALDTELAKSLCVKDFLLKPVNQETLARAIRKALDDKE